MKKITTNVSAFKISGLPVEMLMESRPFEPKFLDELFDTVYGSMLKESRDVFWQEIRRSEAYRGCFWEQVLEKHMPFTKRHKKFNVKGSDFDDFTDAKFAGGARYLSNGRFQLTIGGTKNKTGTLRVCLCVWGDQKHRVWFMLIPYEEYSTWKSPKKIQIKNFAPTGKFWDKYRCSFQEVTAEGV